jgi:tRNA(Ile)-lysidine synthase
VQRHVLRKSIAELRPGLRDISFNAIEVALEYIQPDKPYAEVDLIAGLKLVSEPGKLWVAEWEVEIPTEDWPQIVEELSNLTIGGSLNLNTGWKLSTEKVPQVQSPLVVRARREGDRLQPYGLDGHSQKLSDFMINEKMPKRARDRWPLVCNGEQIIWVPGYRLAYPFRITDSTTEMVNLILTRENI